MNTLLPKARRTNPETSHIAANSARSVAESHIAAISASLRAHGPMTMYELEARLDIDHVAIARRMSDMERAQMVERMPNVTRPSPTGRPCTVWSAKFAGNDFVDGES